MDLCDIQQIKALLSRHGFHFSKSMGQNFLVEDWVPRDIAEASGASPSCGVLEVGPGIGPLTQELSRRAGRVVSVELDRSLLPILSETMAGRENVEIVPGDILKTDLAALTAEKFPGLTPLACANLPYNITSPAITALIQAGCFASITVMIQREVARRLCAPQGSAEGGSFSLFLQYYMKPELLFDVPPEKFLPAPKVTSAVIRCVRREQRLPAGEDHPVQKPPAGGQEVQHLLLRDLRRLRQPGHQQCVVAEGAPQVAAAGEHRGRQLSRVVHHGQFLKSVNVHGRIPP